MDFKYTATDTKTGHRISDTTEAESLGALVSRLRQQGLTPIKISELKMGKVSKATPSFSLKLGRVRRKELIIFTRQLSATLNAGLLLTEALEIIVADLENTYFAEVMNKIIDDVKGGAEFSVALSKFDHIFPKMYISIVKSGEATGWLHKTMTELAQYFEDEERLREKIKTAISYPLFILCFATFVVSILVMFVIPRFKDLFAQLDTQLPFLTQMVVNISEFLLAHAIFVFGGIVFTVFAFSLLSRFYRIRQITDHVKIRIPIIGKGILYKAIVSRFCRTLAFLLSAGVPISKSLKIAEEVVQNVPFSRSIACIHEHVLAGGMISEEIRKQKIFPKLVYKMASVGERTGKIHDMLSRTADYYDDEMDFLLQKLTAMLEPVLIIFVGSIVLVVIVALYLPIFKFSTLIR